MPLIDIPGVGTIQFPDSMSPKDIERAIEQEILPKYGPKKETPGALRAGMRGVMRGVGELGITLGDTLPALAARAVGAEKYAEEQLKEAEESRAKLQQKYPKAVESYKDVTLGTAPAFFAERLGEAIPSIASVLIPGGAAGVGARALGAGLAGQGVARAGAAGAASYAQAAPEVFESVYRETGKMAPGTALGFGAVSAALDAVVPASILSKFNKFGTGNEYAKLKAAEIALAKAGKAEAAKIVAKEAAQVAAKEGLTEAAQESITIAAEQLEGSNKKFFDPENIERIIEAGISGAIAGGPLGAGSKYVERRRAVGTMREEEARKEEMDAALAQEQLEQQRGQAMAEDVAARQMAEGEAQRVAQRKADVEEAVAAEDRAAQAARPFERLGEAAAAELDKTAAVQARAERQAIEEELAPTVSPVTTYLQRTQQEAEEAAATAPLPNVLDLATLKAQLPAGRSGAVNSLATKLADKDLSDPVQRENVLEELEDRMQKIKSAKSVYRDQLESLSNRIKETYAPATDREVQPEAGQPPSVEGVGAPVRPAEQPAVGGVEGVEADGVGLAERVATGDVSGARAGEVAVEGFTTAKGSTYEVTPEGKTVRTKRSPGTGQGETYPPHDVLYVEEAASTDILSDMQAGAMTPNGHAVRLGYIEGGKFKPVVTASDIPADAQPAVAVVDRNKNEIISLHKAQRTPAVGLSPVEKLYAEDGTASTHLGNKIVNLKTKSPTAAAPTPAAPTAAPTPAAPTPAAPTPAATPASSAEEADLIRVSSRRDPETIYDDVAKAVNNPKSAISEFALKQKINHVDHLAGLEETLKNLPLWNWLKGFRGDALMRQAARANELAIQAYEVGPLVFEGGALKVSEGPSPGKAQRMIMEKAKADGVDPKQRLALFSAFMAARRDTSLITDYEIKQAAAKAALADPRTPPDKKAEAKKQLDEAPKRSHLTDDQVRAALTLDTKYPEFAEAAQMWTDFNQAMVNVYLQSGIITPQQAEDWLNNVSYVPFYRVMDGEQPAPGFIPELTGRMSDLPGFKKLKGSERQVDDVFDNMLRNTMFGASVAAKNYASRVSLDALVSLGQAKRLNPGEKGGNVSVFEDGKRVEYYVKNPEIRAAFEGVDNNVPEIIRMIGGPVQIIRKTVTLNPVVQFYMIYKDSLSAWQQVGYRGYPRILQAYRDYVKALVAGPNPDQLEMMRRGVANITYTGTEKERENAIRVATSDPSWAGKVIAALQHNANLVDATVRAQAFKKFKEAGDPPALAAYKASQSIDYYARGRSNAVATLQHFVPFLPSQVQSLRMLYQAATGKGGLSREDRARIQRAYYLRGLTIAGLTVAYTILMSDEPEYERLRDEVRDNYWFVPGLGLNGSMLRIPTPFENGLLFKTIPERLTRLALEADTSKEFKDSMLRVLSRMFVINPMPQGFMPVFETVANYSLFRDAPIVGRGLEGREPSEQYTPYTSETAKAIGSLINYSPAKIDYLVQAYLSQIGTAVLFLTDAIIGTAGENPVEKPSREPWRLPFASTFFQNPMDSGKEQNYYNLKKELDTAVETVNALTKEDPMRAAEYQAKKSNILLIRPAMNKIQKQIESLRERENAIRKSDLTGDQKRELLDEVKEQRGNLLDQVRDLEIAAGVR